jgi:hypothetical protein
LLAEVNLLFSIFMLKVTSLTQEVLIEMGVWEADFENNLSQFLLSLNKIPEKFAFYRNTLTYRLRNAGKTTLRVAVIARYRSVACNICVPDGAAIPDALGSGMLSAEAGKKITIFSTSQGKTFLLDEMSFSDLLSLAGQLSLLEQWDKVLMGAAASMGEHYVSPKLTAGTAALVISPVVTGLVDPASNPDCDSDLSSTTSSASHATDPAEPVVQISSGTP